MTDPSLKAYFLPTQPFGPSVTPDNHNATLFRSYFDTDNMIYRTMSSQPTMIIGRRGSGKTAFLRNLAAEDKYEMVIEIQPDEAFGMIIRTIEEMTKGTVFVEEIARLWDMVLWTTLFAKIVAVGQRNESSRAVEKYLIGIGVDAAMDPFETIQTMLQAFDAQQRKPRPGISARIINQFTSGGVSFSAARKAASQYLADRKTQGIILLDSLEEFPLDEESMAHAIAGLLRCQGRFHRPGSGVEIRICLPAELSNRFMDLSSNPNKDFQSHVSVQWHARELIRLASHRYSLYLSLNHPDEYHQFKRLDLSQREDLRQFLDGIFPPVVHNRLGGAENPIAFILRHTHLLPRQFLIYLNWICVKNRGMLSPPTQILERAVLEGVTQREEIITTEIFSAFRYIYPSAREACRRCLPYLSLRFKYGDLHQVYNRHGQGIEGIYEFSDLLHLLIDIGAVGRVIDETDRYIVGRFEYTAPYHLTVSSEDELCVHPVFTEVFAVRLPDAEVDKRVVYPYGSDVDGPEYREWIL